MAHDGEQGKNQGVLEPSTTVDYTPFGFEPLVGSYPMALEDNGRIVLPAALRDPYEKHAYMVPNGDGCIMVFTPRVFRMFTDKIEQTPDPDFDHPRMVKWIQAMTRKVTVDKQSRMVVPPDLRKTAGIGGRIRVNGSGECIEIWADDEWVADQEPFLGQVSLNFKTYRGM